MWCVGGVWVCVCVCVCSYVCVCGVWCVGVRSLAYPLYMCMYIHFYYLQSDCDQIHFQYNVYTFSVIKITSTVKIIIIFVLPSPKLYMHL